MLEIRLLGQFKVKQDGQPVEIPSRPARLLLAYLVLTAGTYHPRERLAGLLWPESDESNARGNLRQALWRLRKAVGESYILADSKTVAFNAQADYWLDAAMLEDRPDRDLIAAASAYEGELLPGYYEEWVLLERDRLQAAFERTIQRLLEAMIGEQRWPDVLQWAECWIAFGQAPEPAYRALMRAHAAQGDLAAVASAYERCVSALRRDIGVDPSEETQDLHERLSRGERVPESARSTPSEGDARREPQHNLPHQSTPFIGRERELTEVKRLLSSARLLTLIGPGGMGKTRLALQAAAELLDEFRNGVYFVPLVLVGSVDFIVQAIAEAIGFPLSTHEDPQRQLLRHLRGRRYMLVMDNFEHLLDGAALLSEILQAAGGVTILVTTRERLGLQEETILRIEGLAYPAAPTAPDALNYDAVQLFVDSAKRLQPDFDVLPAYRAHVIRICQLVEGMPLGILLAAAWVDMLELEEIASEIHRSLDFLQQEWRNVPDRHRSVQAALEPSWDRLPETQRELYARLAVFRGGFTRAAAQEVAGASLLDLTSLASKSLLRRNPATGRYEIHELLRQYAQERLEAMPDAVEAASKAHARYFAEFIEQCWVPLRDARQRATLLAIEADLENLRRAWRYWLDRRDPARIRMFLDSFWRVYDIRGWYNAGAELFREAVDTLRSTADKTAKAETEVVLARALCHLASFMAHLGDAEKGLALAEESVAILRRLDRPDELIFPLEALQWNASYVQDPLVAMAIGQEGAAIAREQGDPWLWAYMLCWRGWGAGVRQDTYEEAKRDVAESLRLFEAQGDVFASIYPGIILGNMAVLRGAYDEAGEHYHRVLHTAEDINLGWAMAKASRYLGNVAVIMGDYEAARTHLLKSLRTSDELGMIRDVVNAVYDIATVEAKSGDPEVAARLLSIIHYHSLSDQTRSFSLWIGDSVVRIRDLADILLAELRTKLPPIVYRAALEYGQRVELDVVLPDLLGD